MLHFSQVYPPLTEHSLFVSLCHVKFSLILPNQVDFTAVFQTQCSSFEISSWISFSRISYKISDYSPDFQQQCFYWQLQISRNGAIKIYNLCVRLDRMLHSLNEFFFAASHHFQDIILWHFHVQSPHRFIFWSAKKPTAPIKW